jgi:hypothetical protein
VINSGPDTAEAAAAQEDAINRIVGSGAKGTIVVAGIATAIVIAIWFAFYLFVFIPRAIGP